MSARLAAGLVALLLAPAPGDAARGETAAGKEGRIVARFGVVLDGTRASEPETVGENYHLAYLEAIRGQIEALTSREFDVRFPLGKRLTGNWSVEGIRDALDRLLADPEVDIVLTVGVFSTSEAASRRDLPKPVIAPFGIDRDMQDFPFEDGSSGVHNLSYTTIPASMVRDLERFHELIRFDRVHVLYDALATDFLPDAVDYVESEARSMGFEAVATPAGTSADDILERIEEAEAVYLVPLVRMSPAELRRVIDGMKERGIPSFSIFGREDVERGVLAGITPPTNVDYLARRVALNVHRILLGEDPGTLPVELPGVDQLTINMETARAIGWSPEWHVLTEAVLLNEEPGGAERNLSLSRAVLEAVERNLELEAGRRAVASGEQDIATARSALRPRLEASASGLVIDGDRAAAGMQAERTLSGTAGLTQLLYSDAALSNLTVQHRLQEARELELETLRLDIALETASAFLELLRALALARIEESNLDLTESNLRIARKRQELGVAGPAEVYRWESSLAGDRRRVLEARARVDTARSVVNRLLHRPLEERFTPEEPDLTDGVFIISEQRLQPYIGNPVSFDLFREFMVEEGLSRSPELRALESGIAARERTLLAARRAFWSPRVAVSGELTRRFSEGGEGADGIDFQLPPPVSGDVFPQPDDTDWRIGLVASLPILTGGERRAEAIRASEDLAGLRLEAEALAEGVELAIRTSLFSTTATYPAIELTRAAADAARKNLDLVTDTYTQGLVSIIDLLDAQNASLAADQAAANAVFDFMLDLMEVQRATANFDFFATREERDDWLDRLERYFEVRRPAGPRSGR